MSSRRAFLRTAAAGAAAAPLLVRLRAIDEAFARSIPRTGGPIDPMALRERYLLSDSVVYLNHGSIGTVPRAVHEARAQLQTTCESNPWLYIFGNGWEEAREIVRQDAADFVGCTAEDLAITHNTTEGFNLLAQGLPLGPGDEVLFSSMNHDGASVCWRHIAAQRGFSVREFNFPVGDAPGLTASQVVELYESEIRGETRVLVFPHIDNMVGLRHPMAQITSMAHDQGVEFVFVDGAQSVGMIPVDLDASGVDGYAASPHKWIQSPKGLGLLYLREHVRDQLQAMWVTWGQNRWRDTVRIFEDYGTRDMPEVLALGDAIRFQNALGAEAKTDAYRTMHTRLLEAVEATDGLQWRSPRTWEMGASLVSIEPGSASPNQVRLRIYEEDGIVVRAFDSAELRSLRVSPNVATTPAELDLFVERISA